MSWKLKNSLTATLAQPVALCSYIISARNCCCQDSWCVYRSIYTPFLSYTYEITNYSVHLPLRSISAVSAKASAKHGTSMEPRWRSAGNYQPVPTGWSISRILAVSWPLWASVGRPQELALNKVRTERSLSRFDWSYHHRCLGFDTT